MACKKRKKERVKVKFVCTNEKCQYKYTGNIGAEEYKQATENKGSFHCPRCDNLLKEVN